MIFLLSNESNYCLSTFYYIFWRKQRDSCKVCFASSLIAGFNITDKPQGGALRRLSGKEVQVNKKWHETFTSKSFLNCAISSVVCVTIVGGLVYILLIFDFAKREEN